MILIEASRVEDDLIYSLRRYLPARHLVVILLVLRRDDRGWSGKVLLEEEVSLEEPGSSHS